MASGLVTLAYDYAAPGRYIKDGVNGYLAPFYESAAFLQAADRTLEQRAHWPKLQSAARSTAETLGWSGIVRQFAEDLDAAINEPAKQLRVRVAPT